MYARVPINGLTLRWAREAVGIPVDELAQVLNVKPRAVESWEEGDETPTIRQLAMLADRLERTPAFFFTPTPTETGAPRLVDFRGRGAGEVPSAVYREIRRADEHRDAILDFTGRVESQLDLEPFDRGSVAGAAAALRQALIGEGRLPYGKTATETFNNFRAMLEDRGVLVFQTTRIPLKAYRALSVFHEVWPIILVNGSDAANGKVFSLFHELAHLSNQTSGVCLEVEDGGEEALCNAFAAEVLMPEAAIRRLLQEGPVTLASLASRFHVSELAAAIRLRVLGRLTADELELVAQKSQEEWQRNRDFMAARENAIPQWRLRYRDLGPTYVGVLMEALSQGRIDHLDAAHMMNTRVPTVEAILAEYSKRGG